GFQTNRVSKPACGWMVPVCPGCRGLSICSVLSDKLFGGIHQCPAQTISTVIGCNDKLNQNWLFYIRWYDNGRRARQHLFNGSYQPGIAGLKFNTRLIPKGFIVVDHHSGICKFAKLRKLTEGF